jgi:leader peptidase (prepilin peptidase)/N-methyltransferase
MRPVLVAALAVAGLVIGWALRIPIARLTVRAGRIAGTGGPQGGDVEPADRQLSTSPPPPEARVPARQPRTGPPPLATELVTALLLGGLAARLQPGLVLAAACWLAACGVALAWIDATVQRLPDALTALAYAGTTGLLLAAAAASGNWHSLLRAVTGGLGLAVVLAVVAVVSGSALGLGDAKLAASLGTLLAWFGWLTLARGIVAGVLLGAVVALGLIAGRRATRGQRIAFGPFMVAGALLAVLAAG